MPMVAAMMTVMQSTVMGLLMAHGAAYDQDVAYHAGHDQEGVSLRHRLRRRESLRRRLRILRSLRRWRRRWRDSTYQATTTGEPMAPTTGESTTALPSVMSATN